MLLTVIASMEYELAGLRKGLKSARAGAGAVPTTVGPTGPFPDLQVIGVGQREAVTAVRRLLAQRRPLPGRDAPPAGPLLLLGFAGAVDPDLRSGDLVLSSRYYREGPVDHLPGSSLAPVGAPVDYLAPDPWLRAHAVRAAEGTGHSVTYTDSLTTDHLVSTREEKLAIKRRRPVGVVNMEDYWVGAAASEAGIPFLSARVVLDPAHQTLPRYLLTLGRSRAKAAVVAAATPWRIPTLLGLARQLPPAQRALADFAMNFAVALDEAESALEQSSEPSSAAVKGGDESSSGRRNLDPRSFNQSSFNQCSFETKALR